MQLNNTNEPDNGGYRAEYLRAIAEEDRYCEEIYDKRTRLDSRNNDLQRKLDEESGAPTPSAPCSTDRLDRAVPD